MNKAPVSSLALAISFLAWGCSSTSSPADTDDSASTSGGTTMTSSVDGTSMASSTAVTGTEGTTGAGTVNTVTGGTQSTATGGTINTVTGGTVNTVTSSSTTDGAATTTGGGGATSDVTTVTNTTADTGTTGTVDIPEPTLITSGPNAYWEVGEVTEGGSNANITVNEGQTYQTWTGFGGTFNEMGWDALKAVSAADRDLAIKLLFDKVDGCGFTYGRIPIGSSDYGLDRYSLAPQANDYQMTSFSIDRDKQDLIPYIKAALAVNPNIRFWASPWSPPPWMKSNNGFDGGNMKSDAQTLQAHALYLQKFVQAYAEEGIIVEAIHPQNEPGYAQDYPSCLWSAQLFSDYIANYLGPQFAQNLPNTEIWVGTMSNPNSASIVTTVMGNATARGYVSGIGLQWGMGDGNAPSDYAQNYKIPIMQTEHKCGNYPWEAGTNQSKAPNDLAYAKESWGYLKNWITKSVNAYSAWNMVLDTIGRSLDTVRPWAQNALIAVDRNSGQLVITPTYYVFRHLAQYVDPGAVRVGVQGGDALAFKNPDGSIVTVMYNSGQGAAQTTLAVGGTMVQFSIPGQGWATVNWQG